MLQLPLLALLLAVASEGAAASLGCDQGNVSALEPFERELMLDAQSTSVLGHLCFDTTQGASDGYAQALFVLGVKQLSNFAYDYCQFNFKKLLSLRPGFLMGYWGHAMCYAQLVWNGEDPTASHAILAQGRQQQQALGIRLSDREERYYAAAEALNNVTNPDCRACRYQAFLSANQALMAAYPDDANAAAYTLISTIALGTVNCTTTAPGRCAPADTARTLALSFANNTANGYNTNPAILHYSLHAFDYPNQEIYTEGLHFAEAYPKHVNGSTHSLHMPSHIFDRAGNFSGAAAADQDSIAAADAFNIGGALTYQGGPLGTLALESSPSGWGFSFDAGNTYHSVEYAQYELLQVCDVPAANLMTQRMGVAAFQAMAAAGGRQANVSGNDITNMGSAFFAATTYYGWLYRMQARITQQAVMMSLLGQVGQPAESQLFGMALSPSSLPMPLAWAGSTDYSNAFYAPQSEAGLWTALAQSSLLAGGVVENIIKTAIRSGKGAATPEPLAGSPWAPPCGGAIAGMQACNSLVADMALQRVQEVQQHYLQAGIWYESNLTQVLALQIQSSVALASGRLADALSIASQASTLEAAALDLLLPSSTSLYFVPGSAFHGIVALRVASVALQLAPGKLDAQIKGAGTSPRALLQAAGASFQSCLLGRPNLAICLLGGARTQRMLGNGAAAKPYYRTLSQLWSATPAWQNCKEGRKEAIAYAM